MPRSISITIMVLAVALAGGCTMSSTYEKKALEADGLAKDVGGLKQKVQELSLENENLKVRVEALRLQVGNTEVERNKFEKDLKYVTGAKDKLTADNQELDKQLKSKADAESRSMGELKQKVAELEDANGKLKEEIAGLKKTAEEKVRSMGESQGAYEKLRGENAMLQKSIDEKAKQIADAQAKADKIMQEGGKGQEEKSRQLGELKATSEKLQAEVAELKKTIDGKDRQIEELQAANKKLSVDVAVKEKVEELSSTYKAMMEQMKGEIAKGQVTITELKGKLTLNMADSILFDSGKAEVRSGGTTVLAKVAAVLGGVKDKQIRIAGHTDNIQITGALAKKFPSNWELSAHRAINVMRSLEDRGIGGVQMAAVAYADTRPVASNDTADGRAKNRRIEITLVPKE
ncbi:MAG TPA: OmpA family protein [Candidatus Deferrimicrobiaceae bacterium]|jgi:chemotaxis protein MotB